MRGSVCCSHRASRELRRATAPRKTMCPAHRCPARVFVCRLWLARVIRFRRQTLRRLRHTTPECDAPTTTAATRTSPECFPATGRRSCASSGARNARALRQRRRARAARVFRRAQTIGRSTSAQQPRRNGRRAGVDNDAALPSTTNPRRANLQQCSCALRSGQARDNASARCRSSLLRA